MKPEAGRGDPSPDDEMLIRQYLGGSMEAFSLLYRRHLPKVFGRVRYLVPVEDAEDVTQEVFVAAARSLPRYRGDANMGTWLRALTNHKIAEYYRRRGRKSEAPAVALAEAADVRGPDDSQVAEDRDRIQHALKRLPSNYREVILLRLAEDRPFGEISRITGQNLEAVKSLFRRAMTALRTEMGHE
jgi:RNA polymerase sigma-70 factor (ECF subfamily)